jgi:hypothetical protein
VLVAGLPVDGSGVLVRHNGLIERLSFLQSVTKVVSVPRLRRAGLPQDYCGLFLGRDGFFKPSGQLQDRKPSGNAGLVILVGWSLPTGLVRAVPVATAGVLAQDRPQVRTHPRVLHRRRPVCGAICSTSGMNCRIRWALSAVARGSNAL